MSVACAGEHCSASKYTHTLLDSHEFSSQDSTVDFFVVAAGVCVHCYEEICTAR